jgi:hypothetical protein
MKQNKILTILAVFAILFSGTSFKIPQAHA